MSLRRGKRTIMDSEEDDTEDLFPTSQKPQETSIRRSIGSAAKRQTTEIEGLPKTCELMTVFSSSGLILDETRDIEALHQLDCEQALFKKKVEKTLKSNPDFPDNVNLFMDDFKKYLEADNAVLIKALAPVQFTSKVQTSQDPESLIRLLLNIEIIQPPLGNWLVEKMTTLALEIEDEPNSIMTNVPKLILNHFRWLNIIKAPKELFDKLFEILEAEATPDPMTTEIIASLPEILPDCLHASATRKLKKKIEEKNNKFTPTILDTFSNLTLNPTELQDLRGEILNCLPDAKKDDLPIMVKFIVSCVSPQEAIQEIDTLRDKLNLEQEDDILTQIASQRMARNPTQRTQQTQKSHKDFDVLVMDVIRISLTSEIKISEGWIKAIEMAEQMKAHDIMVLMLLHNLPNRKKPVESLIKNKIRNGLLTEDLVRTCFKNHPTFIRSVFESVQLIAGMLMSSTERALNQFSMVLFIQCFATLDRFCKQEIVVDLVTQIGTNAQTRNIGLTTLTMLAKRYTAKLSSHAVYVAHILDYVPNMTLSQVRQIMDILSMLAYNVPNSNGSGLQNDLQITIRKQITTSGKKLSLKQMGVIGAVATVKNMCRKNNSENSNKNNSSAGDVSARSSFSGGNPMTNQAIEILEMVKAATKNVTSVAGLFMDELACIFDSDEPLDDDLMTWITDKMANDFEQDFIVDVKKEQIDSDTPEDAFLPLYLRYGIADKEFEPVGDEEPAPPIAVNLGQMVFQGNVKASRMIPHFRLLSKCISKQSNGDCKDIDALLSCHLWMPKFEKVEALSPQELNYSCDILFYCLNWNRELINTFSNSNNDDERNRVLIRLKQILKIHSELLKVLSHNTSYTPPLMLHLEDVSGWQPPIINSGDGKGKGKTTKGKKGVKRKAGQDITNKTISDTQNSTTTQNHDDATKNDANQIDLNHYKPFFREFDLSVLEILNFKPLHIGSMPSEKEEYQNPQLRPQEFLLILNDLNYKLNHVLVASKNKKAFPGKSKMKPVGFTNLDQIEALEVIKIVIPTMDFILANVENITEHFNRMLEIHDGIIDAPGLYQEETFSDLIACLDQSFGALKSILSWNGFSDQNQLPLLKKALANFGGRLNKVEDNSPLRKLVEEALNYLSEMHNVILNIGCATTYLKLCEVINGFYSESGCDVISKASKTYLERRWLTIDGKNSEKGSKFNSSVEYILGLYLHHVTDPEPLEVVRDYVDNGMSKIMAKNEDVDIEDVPNTLTKNTLNVHFKVLLNFLVSKIKETTYGVNKDHEQQLNTWDSSMVIMHTMVNLIKDATMSVRTLLGPLLRQSRIFVDHFIKHGMPLLDKLFNSQREDCLALLKRIQVINRYLQHVCNHSKIVKDVALSNHVPLLKKSLEQFVYRIKYMLALNNAVEAFWMGNLKNRDLKGKEISSQIMMDSDEEEDADDLQDDGDESEVEVNDGNNEEQSENNDNAGDDESMEY